MKAQVLKYLHDHSVRVGDMNRNGWMFWIHLKHMLELRRGFATYLGTYLSTCQPSILGTYPNSRRGLFSGPGRSR